MRTAFSKIVRWLVRHWGLPSNLQWWWVILGLPAVPAMTTWVITFSREASLGVIVLFVAVSYLLAFGATVIFLPRVLSRRDEGHQRPTREREYDRGTAVIEFIDNAYFAEPPAEQGSVVADEFNRGPVSIMEDGPYVLERPKYIGMGWPVVCLAPYNENRPAATVTIEDAKDIYEVVVSYEVKGSAEYYSMHEWTMTLETRVRVTDERGDVVRDLDVYRGAGHIDEDGSWQQTVSGRSTFVGLPEGAYDLNVVDSLTEPAYRHEPRREYRNMYLRVTRRR